MALENAVCVLLQPLLDTTTDGLGREQREQELPQQRCSCRQVSARMEATVLGRVAGTTYRLRLQTTAPVVAGWRVRVRFDGATEWLTMTVLSARKHLHTELLVERV